MAHVKVHFPQGGNELRVESGGTITAAGTQASNIAGLTALTGGESPTEAEFNDAVTAINAIIAALEGVGIAAAS